MSAVWTNTRRGAGWAGTTIRPCRCWRYGSWDSKGGGWGKKEAQISVPEVRAVLVHLLDTRGWDETEIMHWSEWRQKRNRIAKECHRKRRQANLARRRRC